MVTDSTVSHRRGSAVREAVLDATLSAIGEHGYGFTIDEVAERAGVHKTTVYRNWSTKPQLVGAAVQRLAETTIDIPDTGDVVADLTTLAVSVAGALRTAAGAQAIRAVVAAASDEPELTDMARDVLTSRYEVATRILHEARAAGRLRTDLDPTLVWESIVNPLHMRAILGDPADDATARRLVDHAVTGARP